MIRNLIAGALISSLSFAALAQDSKLSYTNIDLGYLLVDMDGEDFDGYGGAFNAALNDSFFLLGSYQSASWDHNYGPGFDADITELSLGIGYHTPLSANTDLVAALSFVDSEAEAKAPGFSEKGDANGQVLQVGIRSKPSDKVELSAGLAYTNIEDENETGFNLGARFYVTQNASIGLSYGSIDDVDTKAIGVRFDF